MPNNLNFNRLTEIPNPTNDTYVAISDSKGKPVKIKLEDLNSALGNSTPEGPKIYRATLVGEFADPTKVFIVINQTFGGGQAGYAAYWNDADSIGIATHDQMANPSDNLLNNTAFEIIVYP